MYLLIISETSETCTYCLPQVTEIAWTSYHLFFEILLKEKTVFKKKKFFFLVIMKIVLTILHCILFQIKSRPI